ncbi:hypothetical protein GQ44DRAFT_827644 [Phaeosphaeriaceae sp. PMI808]|nr:hypothetical protein GQ44DRAFT_827644 [Phaeosphaeriaceae sp. PMI808]
MAFSNQIPGDELILLARRIPLPVSVDQGLIDDSFEQRYAQIGAGAEAMKELGQMTTSNTKNTGAVCRFFGYATGADLEKFLSNTSILDDMRVFPEIRAVHAKLYNKDKAPRLSLKEIRDIIEKLRIAGLGDLDTPLNALVANLRPEPLTIGVTLSAYGTLLWLFRR